MENQRNESDICENCRFSEFQNIAQAQREEPGGCHVNPPQVVIVPQQHRNALGEVQVVPMLQSVFPPVQRDAWCGKFKPKLKALQTA